MASKVETKNMRQAADNTKSRVGKPGSVASRSRSLASSRSSLAHEGRAMQRGDCTEQSRRSRSIVVSPSARGSTKGVGKRHSSPKIHEHNHCEDEPYRHVPQKCIKPREKWQNGKYCRDECGSGIIAKKFVFKNTQKVWCKTPLSMYQATIGELGRQILCREKIISRDVNPAPPCNICEYIMPPCRGYYRKYDCLRPCEEEYVSYKRGKKLFRDRVERYWEPCQNREQKVTVDINTFAHQNVFLGNKLRNKFNDTTPCW